MASSPENPDVDLSHLENSILNSKEPNSQPIKSIENLVNLLLDLNLINSTNTKDENQSTTIDIVTYPTESIILDDRSANADSLVTESHNSPNLLNQSDAISASENSEDILTALDSLQHLRSDYDSHTLNPNLAENQNTNEPITEIKSISSDQNESDYFENSLAVLDELKNLVLQINTTSETENKHTNNSERSPDSLSEPEIVPSTGNLEELVNLITPPETLAIVPEIVSEKDEEIASNLEKNDAGDPLQELQKLLLGPELFDVRDLLTYFNEKLASLEHQIYDPNELINLLLPLITELLTTKVAESREELANAIAPLIDQMIEAKTLDDKQAISAALAPILPTAIAQQIRNFPKEIATAMAPEMGIAIKQQIELERDAMVDALYPVIGNTIAKYMAEAIRAINEQVENAFSVEGINRKFRAKVQGVSEAELILKEAVPFIVQTIFLIHKASGLVIAEVQQSSSHKLESEMVAGMLTAIRSFVNDCIAQSGEVSELDQIEYGNSRIILEVAGYCYLAVVVQGNPPKWFVPKIRQTLATLTQKYDRSIKEFDGDPDHIPVELQSELEGLRDSPQEKTKEKKSKPSTLLILVCTVLGLIFVPWGIYLYLNGIERRIEAETTQALASNPQLAVYRLKVDVHGKNLTLSGKLPNQYLRQKAAQITKLVAPNQVIENKIIAVEIPADPVLAEAEVKRVTSVLNQIDGVAITAKYEPTGKVTVQGSVTQPKDAEKITKSLEKIPGVKSVTNSIELKALRIPIRIYFDLGSAKLKPMDMSSKVTQVKAFMEKYPSKQIKIIGHSDSVGNSAQNRQLAIDRANAVRSALIVYGIEPSRMQAVGTTDPPIGIDSKQPLWFSRYVEFEPIISGFIRK